MAEVEGHDALGAAVGEHESAVMIQAGRAGARAVSGEMPLENMVVRFRRDGSHR